MADHRHRYRWVKDAPGAYTSHRECVTCGHDPVMAWARRVEERQRIRASKAQAKLHPIHPEEA